MDINTRKEKENHEIRSSHVDAGTKIQKASRNLRLQLHGNLVQAAVFSIRLNNLFVLYLYFILNNKKVVCYCMKEPPNAAIKSHTRFR